MSTTTETRVPRWLLGLAPLLLLAVVVAVFLSIDPLSGLREGFPPVEELTIDRVVLNEDPKEIVLHVTNGGPDPVTVAQVQVDEAYWAYEIDGGEREIPRLGSSTIRLAYPWVDGEAHEVTILSSTGVAFSHEIAVAVKTPVADARTLLTFTLLGLFVGVVPVFLGLLWLPFLRTVPPRWVNFFLALTAGLLVFLAIDALLEATEVAAAIPGAFQGTGVVVLGFLLALAALFALDAWARSRRGDLSPFWVAMLIAAGIGLHNLGEGLAIGAAYALGEVALTAFLVLGFTLHNVTEGFGIVTPLAREKPSLARLVLLGAIAGLPTIAGTWIGGLVYSPTMAAFFLAVGAGAIVQVVWEIAKLMRRDTGTLAEPLNALGFAAGLTVMYGTGLAVAA